MDERKLSSLLREIPPVRASESFTRRTMDRLDDDVARPVRFRLAIAGVLLLVVTGSAILVERTREHRRINAFRSERQAIEAELREIRRLVPEPPPVIYLGSESDIDIVLDLRSPQESAGSDI